MAILSQTDQDRIAAAIKQQELQTSGEIVAVVAAQSDDYAFIPVMWAALIALLLPWPLIFFTWVSIQTIFAIQLVVFLVTLIIAHLRPVRMMLVPRSIKRARAHRQAVEQFLGQGMHTTKNRTGVMIFVSVAEHFAEIIADEGIQEKVPADRWQAIVDNLTAKIAAKHPADGFVAAIEASGALLIEHFPPSTGATNELPNHLIVLT